MTSYTRNAMVVVSSAIFLLTVWTLRLIMGAARAIVAVIVPGMLRAFINGPLAMMVVILLIHGPIWPILPIVLVMLIVADINLDGCDA